jgi:hypothetical protein
MCFMLQQVLLENAITRRRDERGSTKVRSTSPTWRASTNRDHLRGVMQRKTAGLLVAIGAGLFLGITMIATSLQEPQPIAPATTPVPGKSHHRHASPIITGSHGVGSPPGATSTAPTPSRSYVVGMPPKAHPTATRSAHAPSQRPTGPGGHPAPPPTHRPSPRPTPSPTAPPLVSVGQCTDTTILGVKIKGVASVCLPGR